MARKDNKNKKGEMDQDVGLTDEERRKRGEQGGWTTDEDTTGIGSDIGETEMDEDTDRI